MILDGNIMIGVRNCIHDADDGFNNDAPSPPPNLVATPKKAPYKPEGYTPTPTQYQVDAAYRSTWFSSAITYIRDSLTM